MSDDRKEPSAPGLGLRGFILANKARSAQLARPTQWSPGVRVQSADEYEQFTDRLARELQATCTPEHIAVIAAQHMMYANELKCVLEEMKAEQAGVVEVASKVVTDVATKLATEISITVLKSYRTHLSKKRADGVRKEKAPAKALALDMAAKEWRENTEKKLKTGEVAEKVYEALRQTEHRKSVSSQKAVHRWIAPIAPDYAKQPGPSRKR